MNLRADLAPALLLALGFTASAVAAFALTSALGSGLLGAWRNGTGSVVTGFVAAAVLAGLVLVDAGVLGLRTPMWRRQTPRWFEIRLGARRAALLWGLDAGLVLTTFRVTSLSWAALTLTFLGLVPWWGGLAYALGFVLPELVLGLVVPRRVDTSGHGDPEPGWLVDLLLRARRHMRPVSLVVLTAGGACSLLITLG